MNQLFVLAALKSLDGGVKEVALSLEDQEIVDDLELLQNLDGLADLELAQELSVER